MIKELFQDQLHILASNDLMLKALESVFKEQIEKEKPNIEIDDDNKIIGEKYRAYKKAGIILEQALIEINYYKQKPKDNKDFDKSI